MTVLNFRGLPLHSAGRLSKCKSAAAVLLTFFLKNCRREFGQSVSPHLPLVHARCRAPHVTDVAPLQIVGQMRLADVPRVFGAAAPKRGLQFSIHVVRVIEKSGRVLLKMEILISPVTKRCGLVQ
jgi:hypothetical protein